jgi:tetratricopeptide (TPR) repeat protein
MASFDPKSTSATTTEELSAGARLDRYVVLSTLSRDHSSSAYVALDPSLGRKVTLRVIRQAPISGDDTVHLRFVHESQALAQLAHPNVVAIHDAGTVDGRDFMAMEFIEGQPLRAWLETSRPGPMAIVDAFVAAGRGLSAAHAKGIVHRDFRAEHVLVGRDGRVRLTNFAVAPSAEPPPRALEAPRLDDGGALGALLTWAPEQLATGLTDARSDQFTFCVALFTALFGRHPFVEPQHLSSPAACSAAIAHGVVREPPRRALSALSASQRRALLRGLRPDPALRHASMDELLAGLSRRPVVTAARVALAATALALALTFGALWLRTRAESEARCTGAERLFAGVWDDALRPRVERAFAETHVPYAATAFAASARSLDGIKVAWVASYVENCSATQLRFEQSARAMDVRRACLLRRLEEVRAVTQLFVHADAQVVERSLSMASQHRAWWHECEDTEALLNGEVLSSDSVLRERVEGVRAQLGAARALETAGKYDLGIAAAQAARDEALKLSFFTVRAEASHRLASLLSLRKRGADAEAALREGLAESERARNDRLRAELLVLAVRVLGYQLRDFSSAETYEFLASAAVARVGDTALRSDLFGARADLLLVEEKNSAALAAIRSSIGLLEALGADETSSRAARYNSLGMTLSETGDYAEAERALETSIALYRSIHGPAHPQATVPLYALGQLQSFVGRPEEALASLGAVIEVRAAAFGPDDPALAMPRVDVGEVLGQLGRFSEAETEIRLALEIWRKAGTLQARDESMAMFALGELAARQEHWAESELRHRRALELRLIEKGPHSPSVANVRDALGRALTGRGEFALGLEQHRQAMGIYRERVDEKAPILNEALFGQASALLGLGRAGEALPLIERALALTEPVGADKALWPHMKLCLAQIIAATRGDTLRARRLALEAQRLVGADPASAAVSKRIEAFLASLGEARRRR